MVWRLPSAGLRHLWEIVRRAARLFSRRGARFLGAAVAFYALLSAAPLFVFVLRVVGLVFGRAEAESALWGGLERWLTPDGVATVRLLTERFDQRQGSGSVLGVVVIVYGSTRLFRALRRALNDLWGIDLEAIEDARGTAKKYGVRYGGALALAFFVALLVALLVVEKSAIAILSEGARDLPWAAIWSVDIGSSVLLTFTLFTVLFRFLPETDVKLVDAVVSAFVSTVLFALGSSAVSLYLQHKHIADLYAGASAVVLAVIWVYYSAQVIFFGACIGAVLREDRAATLGAARGEE